MKTVIYACCQAICPHVSIEIERARALQAQAAAVRAGDEDAAYAARSAVDRIDARIERARAVTPQRGPRQLSQSAVQIALRLMAPTHYEPHSDEERERIARREAGILTDMPDRLRDAIARARAIDGAPPYVALALRLGESVLAALGTDCGADDGLAAVSALEACRLLAWRDQRPTGEPTGSAVLAATEPDPGAVAKATERRAS